MRNLRVFNGRAEQKRKRNVMRSISFEETKQIELNILLKFAFFCDRHNLRYYLTYGSLIGAVRHKGFIPWDDDIDVQMPRADYNKLIEIFNAEKEDKDLFLIDPKAKNAAHPYVKITDLRTIKKELGTPKGSILGIDIDVFPVDGMPSNEAEYEKWSDKLRTCYKKFQFANSGLKGLPFKTKVHVLLYKVYVPFKKSLLKKAEKLHALYPYETSDYVGTMEMMYNSKKNRLKKEYFDGYSLVEFEGHFLKAHKDYDAVLTGIYGDYMKLPPEDQQVTHHVNVSYWKE